MEAEAGERTLEVVGVGARGAAGARGLARARGLAGFACIKSGDKTGAKEHLELARAEWENYMASNPEDSDAAQAAKWTSDQLKTLQ